MSQVVEAILYLAITTPVMALIIRSVKKEKNNSKSTEQFEVCCPLTYVAIFAMCGAIFIGIFTFIYFYNGLGHNDFDITWLKAGAVATGITFLIWVIVKLWRMDVDGNEVIYRTFWGYKRKTTFDEISAVKETDHKSLIIYSKGRRFGTLNSDFLGLDNFRKRCKEETIVITPQAKSTLTKMGLYFSAMKVMLWIGFFIALAFFLMVLFVPKEVEYSQSELLREMIFLSAFGFLIPVLPGSLLPLRGLSHIARQERALGFRFAEEMKAEGIKDVDFVNEKWFVDVNTTHIVIFRRDYIAEIGKIEPCHGNNKGYEQKVKVTASDGERMVVKSSYNSLSDLKSWFNSKKLPSENL